ncbi:tripartite motif-containing protein 16-like [Toxotes jaculatrix]|uniref:tripartite motif-containing protein 16-like n=1 Tax=Toxotes jaculatrix TaxID=941984 RepID=UPI001B3AF56D|nr:tripartite motif-containing protein 16-like [Toxotes jaculatrix]
MAQQEKLSCSICLDLLRDPVTIPCGHNYCMDCIKRYWYEGKQGKVQSCPQCRQDFIPNPVLVKNTMLADLVEDLKKTGASAEPADQCYAGPEDVACDVCTGRKLKALKSCLHCLVSYCEQHLQPHYESPAFDKHKLVHPSKKIQENICSCHDEVMKIFCRTDQQCICYLCSMDEHKGHDTVSAAAERAERQRELKVNQQKIQQRIQDREKDVKVLQQEVEAISRSADKAVRESEKMFTDLILLFEKRRSNVKQQIRSQQESEERRVKELQEKLEKEISELRNKDEELEKLSHTKDHTQFLQNYPLLSNLTDSSESPSFNIRPLRYFEDVMVTVSEARDKLQHVLKEEWTKISQTVTDVDVLLSQVELRTRAEFLQYSQQITLDPNTANTQLVLSEGNRKATMMRQSVFAAMARSCEMLKELQTTQTSSLCSFYRFQMLSRETLTGCCYWEVEHSGDVVSVAVTYKHTRGTEYERVFGNNDKSWAMYCFARRLEFRHNNIRTSIADPLSSRVGVYLDHRAGILSFYSVSETMTLLHRVQTTFTQPLYVGLGVGYRSTAELR